MKKEYLILFALILILGAYLFVHKENQNKYPLPEIQKIDIAQITGIIIDKDRKSITFTKKEKKWVLTKKEYPADSSAVESMMDTVKNFKLSALVSRKGNLERYGLDAQNKIHVKFLDKKKTVFELSIGKTAPTYNHTFVALNNNDIVYHANGSFRSDFDKTQDDFRDKKILEFKQDSIKKITIIKDKTAKKLIAEKDKDKDKKDKTGLTWLSKEGRPVDSKIVSNLLSSLCFLNCDTYLKDLDKNKLEKEKPLFKISLENKKRFELKIFKADKDGIVNGLSSMSPYAFTLSEYNARQIISDIEKLLGIKKKEKKKE